jgi:hypothetical protein
LNRLCSWFLLLLQRRCWLEALRHELGGEIDNMNGAMRYISIALQ